MLHIGDLVEQLLHDRAQKIRATIKDDAQAIAESVVGSFTLSDVELEKCFQVLSLLKTLTGKLV